MATLGNIIARVENELMYAPDLREHRLDIRQVANARYALLGRDKPWPWLQRRAPLWVFPDIDISSADVSRPVPGSGFGDRTIVVEDSALSTLTAAGDWAQHIRPKLAGAEFGPDPTTVTPGSSSNWEDGPFVVELAEEEDTGTDQTRLWLDPRADVPSDTGISSFRLRWPRYKLPPDLEILERIVDDQGLEIPALSQVRERGYAMVDTAGGPAWALEDHGHAARFPMVVYPGVSDGTAPNPDQTEDIRSTSNLTLRITPSLSEGGGGSITSGVRLRVGLCWWYADRFGPMSPTAEFTTTTTGRALTVSGWSGKVIPISSTTTSGAYGRRLAVFVSENDGAFYLRGWVNPATTSTFVVSHSIDHASTTALPTPTLRMDGAVALPRYDRVYPGGPYTYLRLLPRPVAVARYELDYQARPADLLEDTDALELPDQYSEVLVWATCLGMAERYARGADVSVWERNHREWRARLDQRYMPQLRYRMTKGVHGSVDSFAWIRRENVRYSG